MEKYRIVKSIGDGSFGVVFKAVAPSSEIVAIKKMKSKYKTWEECNVLREIKCLRKLDHPHIVKLQEVILANCELFLVFDYL
jgi:serine/threonine protein kinase